MNELHLFAGAGGGILGGVLLGHTCVCAVEIEPYCRRVLLQRQRDRILPPFPIWDDVRTFDGKPWRGRVDVVCGGFPCQNISAVGSREGIVGKSSGLWTQMARVVYEIRPSYVFVENSPELPRRGMGDVLSSLSGLGYNAKWGVFSACSIGAPHSRERLFLLAHANGKRLQASRPIGDAGGSEVAIRRVGEKYLYQAALTTGRALWPARTAEPEISGVAHGVANRVDSNRAIGNGQVPAVVALAWRVLGSH
jgi:DNA (cytosine-5)-methyltransferase 1